MNRVTVIGYPIAHSRSPLIHGYWLKKHGIPGIYEKQQVKPQDLAAFFQDIRNGNPIGTNVTLPHKENALELIDEPDERARRIGSVNTIWLRNGRLHGTSSDGHGFVASLIHTHPAISLHGKAVTVLGAGGSARAIIDEILRKGADRIYVHNRTLVRAQQLASHFGPKVIAIDVASLALALGDTNLLVNTTSAGLKGEPSLLLPWNQLNKKAIVADIVYTPLITDFLVQARAHHHALLPGLGMLLHQAVVGFEKWFGTKPEVTQELYDLVARDIDPDYTP
jgi:shikimate dehydrogenase